MGEKGWTTDYRRAQSVDTATTTEVPMTTISTYTREAEGFVELNLEVRFTKRSYGGWMVRRADNGRTLGWLTEADDGWEAHVSATAFRGESPDDEGDILDSVPTYLHNGDNSLSSRPIGVGKTRTDAAEEIVYHLRRHHAPALGYGRHPLVTTYQR